ncbi:MAG: phospho-N-acetylmuramoyl-pentapeptide-transferase, partial [Flavisolibacter sp.]|nr:phospho-N-acetylmuramoyl-pentapeptide-transferase [Flavisolibacter sp.]
MLYHLFEWFKAENLRFPGSALFQFITFRVLVAVILSLVISMLIGRRIINLLRRKQIGETVRDLGLAGEHLKKGTPTMGGFIIILALLIPTLLLANLNKVYIRLMILSTVWLGIIGFVDDYLKLRAKKKAAEKGVKYKKGDDDGLAGRFKVFGQVVLGIIVGATLYFNPNVKIWREYQGVPIGSKAPIIEREVNNRTKYFVEAKEPITTIPFVKSHEFNYSKLLPAAIRNYTWILYILIVIFIITAVSNGANITDGLDGLATGTSALIGVCLGVFAYASGNLLVADYLNIMYIPNLGELSIFIGSL